MKLSKELTERYTKDNMSAFDSQRLANFIAFGPIVFESARLLVKFGIIGSILDSGEGMTVDEVSQACGISEYAATVLMEAGLSSGLLVVNPDTERFSATKASVFLLHDPSVKVNMDFNHDVNYEGMFKLEESLLEGRPAGLEHFGDWPTLYEGLSSLPDKAAESWFAFDHFYSDNSFCEALEIVFGFSPERILDVGGNTGRWATKCVEYNPDVRVTIADLPQQLSLMRKAVADLPQADRIDAWPVNLLDPQSRFPSDRHFDVIWMSQFLDCFSEEEIESILKRAASVMDEKCRLCIMETFWDNQRFETASFCLTMTSLYFTALANGNSRMYHSEKMKAIVEKAGLEMESLHDNIGLGHSIMVCKLSIK